MAFRGILFCVVLNLSSVCFGQGLRISTHVYDLEKTASPGQMVSSSLSLCHNGRIYDYVDAADEVVIFDPVERRFTILNNSRGLSTALTFDEIRHKMDSLEPRTTKYIQELRAAGTPKATRTADAIAFQLHPVFEQNFDSMKETLVLTSPAFTYRVETSKWDEADQVERYLVYADWTARLNFIIHPNSLLPEPRIALNEALRQLKNRMPVSVELDLRPNENLHLRAAHQLTRNLSADDHRRIAAWDANVKSKSLKEVPFLNYQQAVLVSRTR
ncbi:MAG: hypothetical protein O2856_07980 [Planctomycetota bacterium]|nr:hypothetical protein [Planctomycetota bacterium]